MGDRISTPSPCMACGERPKIAGRGHRWCEVCRPIQKEMQAQKEKKWLEAYRREHLAERRARERQRYAEYKANQPPREPVERNRYPIIDGKRECNTCHETLPVSRFGKTTKTKSGVHAKCRQCTSEYNHERSIRINFGLTPEQYLAILDYQGGVCWICQTHPRTRRLAVDHNHKTGEVRGLLCKRCNRDLLGRAHDDPTILRRAADYLEHPPAPIALGPGQPGENFGEGVGLDGHLYFASPESPHDTEDVA